MQGLLPGFNFMNDEEKIEALVKCITREKARPSPDKSLLLALHREIRDLKDDYREVGGSWRTTPRFNQMTQRLGQRRGECNFATPGGRQ